MCLDKSKHCLNGAPSLHVGDFLICGSAGKESTCNAWDLCSVPGLGRSPGKGKGYPLQYSGLKNSMDYIHGIEQLDTTEKLSLSSLYELNLTQHLFAHSISLEKPHKTFTMSLVNKSKCWEDVFVLWLEMACKLWDHCPLPGWQYLALCIFHLAISEFILKKKKTTKNP